MEALLNMPIARSIIRSEGDNMADKSDKSMILNIRTLRASGQPAPPYNEVMAFLAVQNKTQMPEDLLLFDQETLNQMPEELRGEMMDMIKKVKSADKDIANCT